MAVTLVGGPTAPCHRQRRYREVDDRGRARADAAAAAQSPTRRSRGRRGCALSTSRHCPTRNLRSRPPSAAARSTPWQSTSRPPSWNTSTCFTTSVSQARAMRRIGAVEFATTIAPGLRDVLLTGKIKETVVRLDKNKLPVYDAIVVDAPPTGRIARFLDVTKAVSDLAKGGPVHAQSEGVVKLLHSNQTAIHLVTLLEALPVQETLEAIEELAQMELPIGSVIVNRNIPAHLEPQDLAKAAEGEVDADSVRAGLLTAGVKLPDADFAGLLTETIQHATRITARAEIAQQLDALQVPRLELPTVSDGVDLGSLYELSESLAQQGVR
ncbi:putative ATPase [Mycobacterium tuberculosis T46]|nr:putative ATPase [Mycobacterium tuberculosis T46]